MCRFDSSLSTHRHHKVPQLKVVTGHHLPEIDVVRLASVICEGGCLVVNALILAPAAAFTKAI